jgi:hypothetical protein
MGGSLVNCTRLRGLAELSVVDGVADAEPTPVGP